MSTPLAADDKVVLLDSKKRRYLIDLEADGEFHSHAGFVRHSDIIGQREGCRVRSTKNSEYIVLRPTLEDFVIEMPRGAQVIYPKDLAPICMFADIGPGIRVFESGIGSGALSTTMLRYGAEIVGYEIREDFANRAKANVRGFLGESVMDRYDVHIASSYDGIDPAHGPFDRVVLDLPEPWQVVPHAEEVLRPGGILLAYTPSIMQAAQVREALKGKWIDGRTVEVLHRTWHIDGQAVRPDHRMVAHTGFLSLARFLGKNEPTSANPAVANPAVANPDSEKSDSEKSDSEKPESEKSDSVNSDSERLAGSNPDGANPGHANPAS